MHEPPVIVPATPERWADIRAVFEGRGDPGTCWCQWFIERELVGDAARAEAARRAQLAVPGPEPGLVAYDDAVPAAWRPRC